MVVGALSTAHALSHGNILQGKVDREKDWDGNGEAGSKSFFPLSHGIS